MGKTAPSALFSAGDPYAIELRNVAQESADAIAKAHDWRLLTTLHTLTGDGSTEDFSLPSDYDRMPVKAALWSTEDDQPLCPARDLDHWMDLELNGFVGAADVWIILTGQIKIKEAPAATESIKFFYQSNAIVAPLSGSNKAAFTADDDTFRLSERLLALDVIWRWRSMKKLDYSEEMTNFEIAMAQEVNRDKGSRILSMGRPRSPEDAALAYPRTLSAS